MVFGGYVILAISVTVVQLSLEYSSVQNTISDDLASLAQSFNGGVAGAMWEMDRSLLKTIAQGIAQSSIVTGVKISSTTGEIFAVIGEVPSAEITNANNILSHIQFHTSHLQRQGLQGMRELGELSVYSNRSIAIERVTYSFIVILINSLIKTVGLWVIFYLVITRSLSRPLSYLTDLVSRLEFAAESKEPIPLDYPHPNELGRLMGAMRRMQERLFTARSELEQVNQDLEETIAERTRNLADAVAFNETILLNSPVPVGVYAATGQCVLANDAYAELVATTRDALLAQNFHNIDSWQNSSLLGDCMIALAQHVPQHREANVVTSFGKEIWIDYQIIPTLLNGIDHLLIQFHDLSTRKSMEEELRHVAMHDSLTRLPNRRLLLDRISHALRTSKRQGIYFAILFLDLNKLKVLNDTHGHEAGDMLLIEVAKRLLHVVRDSDTVARFGGDEFVVLLEGGSAEKDQAAKHANSVADKIHEALSVEYILGDIRHQSSASIGIELFLGDERNPEQLLKEADATMYKAKKKFQRETQA